MKDVQCYELFGGIALKNHAFSLSKQALYAALYIAKVEWCSNVIDYSP